MNTSGSTQYTYEVSGIQPSLAVCMLSSPLQLLFIRTEHFLKLWNRQGKLIGFLKLQVLNNNIKNIQKIKDHGGNKGGNVLALLVATLDVILVQYLILHKILLKLSRMAAEQALATAESWAKHQRKKSNK